MFFRFGVALVLITLISLAGIALEKSALELKQKLTTQAYRIDQLQDLQARRRVEAQKLSAPERLAHELEQLNDPKNLKDSAKSVNPDAQQKNSAPTKGQHRTR